MAIEDPVKILLLLMLREGIIERGQYDQIERRMGNFIGRSYDAILRELRSEILGNEDLPK